MAKIIITSKHEIYDGMSLTFKSPCDCAAVDGLRVNYSGISQTFSLRDAHGNSLADLSDLFTAGAYVNVIFDTTRGYAYLQNADTNSYIEGRLKDTVNAEYVTTAITEALGEVATSMAALDEVIGGDLE